VQAHWVDQAALTSCGWPAELAKVAVLAKTDVICCAYAGAEVMTYVTGPEPHWHSHPAN